MTACIESGINAEPHYNQTRRKSGKTLGSITRAIQSEGRLSVHLTSGGSEFAIRLIEQAEWIWREVALPDLRIRQRHALSA